MALDSPASREASLASSRSNMSAVVHVHTPRSDVTMDVDDDFDALPGQEEPLPSGFSLHNRRASEQSWEHALQSDSLSTVLSKKTGFIESMWIETEAGKQLVDHCKNENSIVELTPDIAVGKCALAFRVCLVKLAQYKDQGTGDRM